MFVIEKREYRYEDRYDWSDNKSFVRRDDGSLVAYKTVEAAEKACKDIIATYNPERWYDIGQLWPTTPVVNTWYQVAECYFDKDYLRIVEVRV